MLDLLKNIIPYPFIFETKIYDGYLLSQAGACKKCDTRDCIYGNYISQHYVCSKGFSCYCLQYGELNIIINGVTSALTRENFKGPKKKQYKERKVEQQTITTIQNQLNSLSSHINDLDKRKVQDSVSFLHDIRTSVGIVLSWCQEIISIRPGNTFEEKLERADKEITNLFQSINLLQEQLNLADIIANPDSVDYGHKHVSQIHNFIYKMVKLFEPRALERGVWIELRGKTHAEIEAYNSFQFIPLILLDNAVKYSYKHRGILVYLDETEGNVSLKISSYGKIVPYEHRDKIFNKYVRGPNATAENPYGMGLGLYIARIIARLHDTDIIYDSHPEGADVGNNEFLITVAKVNT